MKKVIAKTALIALSALFTLNATAATQTPVSGKEYHQIRPTPSAQKQVVEFFSFYCPHCYNFEAEYKIPSKVKAGLPSDVEFIQYHVDFLGKQSEQLTRAWAFAMASGVQEKVKMPLFEAAQADAIKSMDDVRAIFIANGISAEQFDGGINSFAVSALVNRQLQAADAFNVRGVPSFFVHEQYALDFKGFEDSNSTAEFIQRYVDTVLFLAKK